MPTDEERNAIRSHLLDYADDIGCRILAARDYGSRARGLDGPNSDYDVMFVFAQPPAEYAIGRDTNTYSKTISADDSLIDTEIELHGWNLKKFLGGDGLNGSNPTAMEFVLSDETYVDPPLDAELHFNELCNHARDNFKPYALINHYRSMAASNYGKYVEQSWVREWSNDQFQEFAGTQAGQTSIDEETGTMTIGILGYDEHTIEIPLDEAQAEGMIRRTTRDPTIKRHLNVIQALMRARYVEETHEPPTPMDFNEFLRMVSDSSWLPDDVYARAGDYISEKIAGNGERNITDDPTLHSWIESELGRDVEAIDLPDDGYDESHEPSYNHVQRNMDTAQIMRHGREIYNNLDWHGT